MKTAEIINTKKLNKSELNLLNEEIKLAVDKLLENYERYNKNHKNPTDLIMWFGRYVSLARIFEVKLIEDWKISHIHSLVITFGTGAMEHYRTV